MQVRYAALAVLFLLPLHAHSQGPAGKDWPQWRGPNRDNISRETGLLSAWPKEGPRLIWSAKEVNGGKSIGTGMSSLAITDGRLYTLGDRGKEGLAFCVDAGTGKVLWQTPFCPNYGNPDGSNPGPRCTPTVAGNRLYGLSAQGVLACFDTAGGKLLWKKDLKKDFGGQMMSGWNYSESPFVDGDKLVCTPGGKAAGMVALNKETGDLIWKCELPERCGAGYASIVPADVAGVRQYITVMGSELGLVGVEAKTGKFLWNYRKVANSTANIPTPLVQGDLVFSSTGYGTGAALLQLVPDGKGSVSAAERYFLRGKVLENHHGGMVLLEDHVYGGHGHNNGLPFCLDMKTGKMKWGPERGPGSGSATCLYADGHLYFRYQDNVMALVEATPAGYTLKSQFRLPKGTSSPGWQHPIIHEGRLYVRAHEQIYCYDVRRN